ncbi:MAG: Hpt domain-containing protein [Patescibacteria group bacterium]
MDITPEDKMKYKPLYVRTARAYINDMQQQIAILLKEPHNTEAIGIIHMAAHSLGSQSLVMGYSSIGELARLIEKIFRAKKDTRETIESEILASINVCVKRMIVSLYEIEKTGEELALTTEIKQLTSLL